MLTFQILMTVVGCILLLFFIGFIIGLYNQLVIVRESVAKAWGNIDVLLKQRHDELIKLVDVCKKYISYENEMLTKIVSLRNKAENARTSEDINKLGVIETPLNNQLSHLFALAENYPDLKSNNNFMHLQNTIHSLETSLADRRELYNEAVNINNICIQEFPSVILAKMFGFKKLLLLEFSDEEKQDINIASLF